MKYSLRSLIIVAILVPPLLAGGWLGYRWLVGGRELIEEEFDPEEVAYVADSRAFRRTYTCDVTRGRLAATPKWRDGDESPPVSARRALRIADQEAAAIAVDERFQRHVQYASLVNVGRDWLWEVRYDWTLRVGGGSGIADNYAVVILMDGSVVKPAVEP